MCRVPWVVNMTNGRRAAAPASLGRYREAVRGELLRALEGLEGPLYTMVRYHMGWVDQGGRPEPGDGGKGLRSTLCLLSHEACGGVMERALPAAAALELVHNFSLVHDDIQDHSPERHFRPTVWSIWGEAQGINAGDALFALARLTLLRLQEHGVPADVVLKLCAVLDETCLSLCEGQQRDLALQGSNNVGVEQYLEMIGGKTAALMAASCRMGAALGSVEDSVVAHFSEAGRHMGLAFQVRDDYLGVWGNAAELGKPVMEDVWERKKGLPAVYGLGRASGRDRALLRGVYAGQVSPTGVEVERAVAVLEDLGAKAYCEEVAGKEALLAVGEIEASGCENQAAGQLRELARFSAERDY